MNAIKTKKRISIYGRYEEKGRLQFKWGLFFRKLYKLNIKMIRFIYARFCVCVQKQCEFTIAAKCLMGASRIVYKRNVSVLS